MPDNLLTEPVLRLLSVREFISVASSDFDGRPNVAPKFILTVEDGCIYLVDYVIGRTYRNIESNPRVSLSTIDIKTLVGYQMNGSVQVLSKGPIYDKMIEKLHDKQISFSTKRIIEGVRSQKSHESFELAFPERVVIFKVKVEEVVEIGPSGKLERKKI